MWVCPWHGAHTEVREQLVRVDLCLSHVGSRYRSQLVRLGRQRLCPPSHLIHSQECIPEQQTVWSCCFSVCDGYVWSMHMYAVAHVCTLETWEGWWMPCYLTLYPIFFFWGSLCYWTPKRAGSPQASAILLPQTHTVFYVDTRDLDSGHMLVQIRTFT